MLFCVRLLILISLLNVIFYCFFFVASSFLSFLFPPFFWLVLCPPFFYNLLLTYKKNIGKESDSTNNAENKAKERLIDLMSFLEITLKLTNQRICKV